MANIITIFKKDDCTICSNYCPISLLSNVSKIIEKLLQIQFATRFPKKTYLKGNLVLNLVTSRLLEIREKIKQAYDSGKNPLAGICWYTESVYHHGFWYAA